MLKPKKCGKQAMLQSGLFVKDVAHLQHLAKATGAIIVVYVPNGESVRLIAALGEEKVCPKPLGIKFNTTNWGLAGVIPKAIELSHFSQANKKFDFCIETPDNKANYATARLKAPARYISHLIDNEFLVAQPGSCNFKPHRNAPEHKKITFTAALAKSDNHSYLKNLDCPKWWHKEAYGAYNPDKQFVFEFCDEDWSNHKSKAVEVYCFPGQNDEDKPFVADLDIFSIVLPNIPNDRGASINRVFDTTSERELEELFVCIKNKENKNQLKIDGIVDLQVMIADAKSLLGYGNISASQLMFLYAINQGSTIKVQHGPACNRPSWQEFSLIDRRFCVFDGSNTLHNNINLCGLDYEKTKSDESAVIDTKQLVAYFGALMQEKNAAGDSCWYVPIPKELVKFFPSEMQEEAISHVTKLPDTSPAKRSPPLHSVGRMERSASFFGRALESPPPSLGALYQDVEKIWARRLTDLGGGSIVAPVTGPTVDDEILSDYLPRDREVDDLVFC